MIGQGLFTIKEHLAEVSFEMENRGLGMLETQ